MGSKSKILWTDSTWSPVTGCTKVSEGCENCYARRIAKRFNGRCNYPEGDYFSVKMHPGRVLHPYRWKKGRKIFVCSMGDLFHKEVPDEFIAQVFNTIKENQQHTFILLTKRIERAAEFIAKNKLSDNAWMGVTAENQIRADERIPYLAEIEAPVRFVSVEPMLWHVNITPWMSRIDWVICGGESGPKARPMHPKWPRNLINQCYRAEVPIVFKQWGEWISEGDFIGRNLADQASTFHEWNDGTTSYRVGRKKAGRVIDGRVWEAYPEEDEGDE